MNAASVQRFCNKNYVITASISDAFINLCMEQQGVQGAFKDFQKWKEKHLPRLAKLKEV